MSDIPLPEKNEKPPTFKCGNCGEEFTASKKPMFCIVCGQKLTESAEAEKTTEKAPQDIFFCPRCHTPHKLSINPRFCMSCRFEFIRDATGKILVDDVNYGYMPVNPSYTFTPQGPSPQLVPNPVPFQGYPVSQGYPINQGSPMGYYPPPIYYKPIKPKTWNVGPGIMVPLLTMVGVVVFGLIFTLIFLFLNPNSDLSIGYLETFVMGSVSLLFFIVPVLWIQRYYPTKKLTFAEKMKELGLPLDKYSKIEKFREILFGAVFGVLGVLLITLMTSASQWLTELLFGVDPMVYSSQGLMDQFNLEVSSGWDVILFVSTVVLFVGVPEEVMFRGFAQRCFEVKLKRPAATLLIAIYFALFHIFLYITIPALFFFLFVPYLVISLLLGLVRNSRGDLYAAVSMHIVYDITQIIMIYFILF